MTPLISAAIIIGVLVAVAVAEYRRSTRRVVNAPAPRRAILAHCADCDSRVVLSVSARCSRCDSDAVVTIARLAMSRAHLAGYSKGYLTGAREAHVAGIEAQILESRAVARERVAEYRGVTTSGGVH